MPWAEEWRYTIYIWFDNGDEGYVVADGQLVNALIPSDGIRSASYWRARDNAETWANGLIGWAKTHYLRHEIHKYSV